MEKGQEGSFLDVLPRGRHSLSRDEIAASQRRRILTAMIDEVGDHGYVATTASSVYARAGVSSRSFYEQFANKEDCFIAAYDRAVEWFITEVRPAIEDSGGEVASPLQRFGTIVRRYVEALAENPNFARAILIEIYAVGPRALQRRQEVQRRFSQVVEGVLHLWGDGSEPSEEDRFAVQAFVGSITFLVTVRVAAGDVEDLPALCDPIVRLAQRYFPGVA